MKFFISILCVMLALLFNSYGAENRNFNVKIAIVDIQLVLEDSIAIQKLKKSIENISKTIQQEVSKKEVELKSIEEELVKKKGNLGEKDFENEITNFNKKVSEVQQDIQSKKLHLEQAHNDAFAQIHEAVIAIITELAAKYEFNLVLPSSQVLYATDALNITNEVRKLLNQRVKEVDIKF